MVNQQKGVQQDTAYSAVVVNVPVMDGDTYDHSLQLHYTVKMGW